MIDENRWTYVKVDISLIDEAEQNANIMSEADFNVLCENIGVLATKRETGDML